MTAIKPNLDERMRLASKCSWNRFNCFNKPNVFLKLIRPNYSSFHFFIYLFVQSSAQPRLSANFVWKRLYLRVVRVVKYQIGRRYPIET